MNWLNQSSLWTKQLEKDELVPCKYKDHTCHNTSGHSASGKHLINVSRFDSVTLEE